MKSSTARLALNLGLVTVAVSLMCIGNYWLYFLGWAMMLLSLNFSLSPLSSSGARATGARNRMSWFQWLAGGLWLSIVVVIFLWLTGWGRKGLALHDAFLLWLVFAVPEVRYWLASRTFLDMPVSQLLHASSSRPPRTKQSTNRRHLRLRRHHHRPTPNETYTRT